MKKILKTIAMLLIVIMLANSFTSCTAVALMFDTPSWSEELTLLAIGIDATILVMAILGVIVSMPKTQKGAYSTTGAASGSQPRVLSDKIEQSAFMEAFYALPKTQTDTLTQKINALPEAEITSFMETFNSTPKTDMISIDELNTVSETELYNTVEFLNSLSRVQFISLLKNIQYSEAPDTAACDAANP